MSHGFTSITGRSRSRGDNSHSPEDIISLDGCCYAPTAVSSSNAITDSPGSRLKTFRRLKFLVWFQERLRPTDLQVTLIWAGVIGFCGGVSSIAFRFATSIIHNILTGNAAPGLVESFSELPRIFRLVVPAVGGLLAGAILQFGTRLRGHVTTT